ncbi:MAG: histidinol dehydrogenase [Armatimonadota bacterium]|nr:MAG: histidinol dehydrogenase [Armatimonadota bacterium]
MRILTTRRRTAKQIADELSQSLLDEVADQEAAVREIVEAVRTRGDDAVIEYTRRFDCPDMTAERMPVSEEEFKRAKKAAGKVFLEAVAGAVEHVRTYHEKQRPRDWFDLRELGTVLGQKFTPIERVGIHVPGFTAVYPSSLIMTAVPGLVAGVDEIVLCTPADSQGNVHPATLATADFLGLHRAFKVGGPQAVAALAYGTETIPKADKIFGPGSVWVQLAKKIVYGTVGVDGLYGPSEVVVLADETAEPRLIAADLLAQAEHGPDSPCVLVTPARSLVDPVKQELARQVRRLNRKAAAWQAITDRGAIVLTKDLDEACDVVNELAPEHVQICTDSPFSWLPKIRHAGCISVGSTSPVTLGDYVIGPSHVLPTGRTARFSSGLATSDFFRRSSVIYTSKEAVKDHADIVRALAALEGLDGHIRAMTARLRKS